MQIKKENNLPLKSKRIADSLILPAFAKWKFKRAEKSLETLTLFVGRIANHGDYLK